MKKKLICTMLVLALVLCAMPIAFPNASLGLEAIACEGCSQTPCIYGSDSGTTAGEEQKKNEDYFVRYFVWVERGRDDDGLRNDKIVMELIPVEEAEHAEYLSRLNSFSGWELEDAELYAPADAFFTGQVQARLKDFELEHYYGGKSSIEIGLIDEVFNAPSGAVYYEHKAFADSSIDYALLLRVGELKIEVPAEYTKADFSFAARPDGSGGWEIILRDADGKDIDYTLL